MYKLGRSGRWHNAKGHFAKGADVSRWLDRQAGREYLADTFKQHENGQFRKAGRYVSQRVTRVLESMTLDERPFYSPGITPTTFEYVPKPGALMLDADLFSVGVDAATFSMKDSDSQELKATARDFASGDIAVNQIIEMRPSPSGWHFEIEYTIGILHKKGVDYYERTADLNVRGEADPNKALGEAFKILFEGTKIEKYANAYQASISEITVNMMALD